MPFDALEAQAQPVRESVAAQVEAAEQLQEMVAGLEQRYDRMITSGAGTEVPTADDIAAEVEEYLAGDRKSTRLNSSHVAISYAVFCLKKKKKARIKGRRQWNTCRGHTTVRE